MFGGSGSNSSSFTPSPTPPWAHEQPATQHLPPIHGGGRWSPEPATPQPVPGPAADEQASASGGGASSDLRSVLSGPNLSLWSLQDAGAHIKPSYPYPTLIACAILGSERKMLTLEELYDAIEDRFPYFKSYKPYRNSIRHNLSLNAMFVKTPRPITAPGKGNYWAVREGASLTAPGGTKRPRKRGPRGKNKEPSPASEMPLQSAKYTMAMSPAMQPPLDIYLHREAATAPYGGMGYPPIPSARSQVSPHVAHATTTSPTRSSARRPSASTSAAGPVRTMRRARSPAVTPYVIPVTSDEYPPSPPPAGWMELDPVPALHYGSSLSPDDGDWLPSPNDGGVLLPSASRRATAASSQQQQQQVDPPSSSSSSPISESEDVLASRPSAVPLPAFGTASLTLPSIGRPVLPAAPSFGATGFGNVPAIMLPPLAKRTRF